MGSAKTMLLLMGAGAGIGTASDGDGDSLSLRSRLCLWVEASERGVDGAFGEAEGEGDGSIKKPWGFSHVTSSVISLK
jgi:hypothetical protein